jgi:murein DD-endopeptidase MepM/ murein hydrolase activator NlpD
MVLAGFAGYFIPFNSFTLDVVEQNQRRNLSDLNTKLLARISTTLHLSNSLKDETVKLYGKREHLTELTGLTYGKQAVQHHRKNETFADLGPSDMSALVEQLERQFQMFASDDDNVFTRIPVCKPVSEKTAVSRGFGPCNDPFTGKLKNHIGIDFAAEAGAPVIATASGTVSRIESDPVWGKRVTIMHRDGYKTVYAHLGPVKIKQDRSVHRGTLIALIGISGLTTGPHVHYEIWRNGQACNPEDYFFPSVDSLLTASN